MTKIAVLNVEPSLAIFATAAQAQTAPLQKTLARTGQAQTAQAPSTKHEQRTWAVAAVNALAMAVLVAGGLLLGSAAVLAEGLHTGTHVGAVVITGLAYRIAAYRRAVLGEAAARRVGDLAGLANGAFLIVVALVLVLDSLHDLRHPVAIDLYDALALAVFGLVVTGVSLALLHHAHWHENGHRGDLSFRAVYLHMIGDAAAGVLAIAGLLAVRLLRWTWADGAAGLAGAALILMLAAQIIRVVFTADPVAANPTSCRPLHSASAEGL